ncbi:MAG: ABC transporter ATP-binding protein [Myxococcota bacterium]
MSEAVVSVRGFRKTFRVGFWRKKVEAVRGIDFEVRRGEIFGLLGPNGAGKTTTLKTLLRLTFPTEGTLKIFGLPPSNRASMLRVGYMPENPYVYQYLRPAEFLDLCGRLLGMKREERRTRIDAMIETVGLGHARDRPIGRFSKGMMQRVGLAQALLHDPELLILDEPMSGLDPIGRKEVRDVLLQQKERGKTLIFTSHILSDVEMLCDRVVILRHGKVEAEGSVESLLRSDGGVDVRFEGAADALDALRGLGALAPRGAQWTLELPSEAVKGAVDAIHGAGGTLLAVTPHTRSLESFFVDSDGSEGGGAKDAAAE